MRRLFILLGVLLVTACAMGQAKYVFMFIGDGMGPHQVLSTEMYFPKQKGKPLRPAF